VASAVRVASLAFTGVASVPSACAGLRPSHPGGDRGLPRAFRLASVAGSTMGSGGAAHHPRSLIEQLTEIRRLGVPALAAGQKQVLQAVVRFIGRFPGGSGGGRGLRLPSLPGGDGWARWSGVLFEQVLSRLMSGRCGGPVVRGR